MTTLTTRAGKGSPLTNAEMDANLNALNAGKLEVSSNLSDLANAATARTNLGVAIGTNVQAYSAELTAVAALSTGIAARTGVGTWAARTIAVAAAGLAISNADGVAGNPTINLANDLSALEALASTGIAVRTAADTWAQRSIAGTSNRIAVTNGNGVAGNPTIDIDAAYVGQASITTVGTIATGTWASTITTADSVFSLTNGTKVAKFSASAISGGTTRTYTLPDVTDTLVTLGATQTLTAKTLTSPTINTPTIFGGAMDITVIGALSPAAGTFTTATVTGAFVLPVTSSASIGVINQNGLRLLHTYGNASQFFGYGAGNFTNTGIGNVGIGNVALNGVTTGNFNTAIGNNALSAAGMSAAYNVAIGSGALALVTTSGNNVAIGANALGGLTTGLGNNVAIGFQTMQAATTAASCIAIGLSALNSITSGGGNVAIGITTLSFATTGIFNVAVGNSALVNLVGGSNNCAYGVQALLAVTSGNYNVGIGYSAMDGAQTASNCVAIGRQAGGTGANANVSGNNNTWVGYQAGPSTATQLSNSSAFGANATNNASNQITFGDANVTQIRSLSSNSCDLGTTTEQFKTLYLGTSIVLAATSGNVNGLTLSAATTTNAPTIDFTGTDTNVTGKIRTKGTGSLLVQTNAGTTQLEVVHTASATRYVQITGSNGANPSITTSAGSLILTGASAHVAFGSAALATNATTGFVCIPSCAGAPTGVPASIPTGQLPMVFDSTNLFLYVYTGGTWKKSSVYA